MKYTTNKQHTSSGISHFHVQDPPHKHHRISVCLLCSPVFLSTYIETSFLLVSRCDHPRCLSRLVIVPKREPGSTKDSAPTGHRVTMNAVISGCIKPAASITPLATDEIKKLHHYKYYLQLDGSQAFWSIPLTEESKKLLAFQTHEGVFAWDRLTMRPAQLQCPARGLP